MSHREPIPLPRIRSVRERERFNRKVLIYGPGSIPGCWIWHGRTNEKGYGRILWNGHQVMAHRFAYALYRGAVPAGMTVNHKYTPKGFPAPVLADVNPDNLELCTLAVNIGEGNARNAANGIYRGAVRVQLSCLELWYCPRCNGTMTLNGVYRCKNCDHTIRRDETKRIRQLTQILDAVNGIPV